MQVSFISQVVNQSLEAKSEQGEISKKLLFASDALFRAPVKADLFSKIIRSIRNTFCTKSWCLYSDFKDNLSLLSESLQRSQVPFTISDATNHLALRKFYHGDAKALVCQTVAQLGREISQMGLSDAKQSDLLKLIQAIETNLVQNTLYEEQQQYASEYAQIKQALLLLDSDPVRARQSLEIIRCKLNDKAMELPIGEEFGYAMCRLEQKEKIRKLEAEFSDAQSVHELFVIAKNALEKYRPDASYDEEVNSLFTKELLQALEIKSREFISKYRQGSIDAADIALPEDIILPEGLQKAHQDYKCLVSQTFHEQFLEMTSKIKQALVEENDLAKLQKFRQAISYFQLVLAKVKVPGIEFDCKELDALVDAKCQKVTQEHKSEIQAKMQSVAQEAQEQKQQVEFGGKPHTVMPIPASQGVSVQGLSFVGVGMCIYVAVKAGQVVFSGRYPLTPGGILAGGCEMLVHTYLPVLAGALAERAIIDVVPFSQYFKKVANAAASVLVVYKVVPDVSYFVYTQYKTSGWGAVGQALSLGAAAVRFNTGYEIF